MFTRPTNIHPLVAYIRNWQAFNSIDRKQFRYSMLKILIGCISVMMLLSYITQ
ncbi:hypothetical protein [Marinoscillum pacificum]|uniref:hypothetical protein n=1 Tax=Marinoscillum pacificum TaxID=392723 RepID=UPI0021571E66|nr:hypothetical protein [Marinoscillum pacificum]